MASTQGTQQNKPLSLSSCTHVPPPPLLQSKFIHLLLSFFNTVPTFHSFSRKKKPKNHAPFGRKTWKEEDDDDEEEEAAALLKNYIWRKMEIWAPNLKLFVIMATLVTILGRKHQTPPKTNPHHLQQLTVVIIILFDQLFECVTLVV